MQIDHSSTIKRNQDQIFNKFDNEIVMLSIENGEYYNLSSVGSEIWEHLKTEIIYRELIEKLIKKYKISFSKCSEDVEPFILELYNLGLISIDNDK